MLEPEPADTTGMPARVEHFVSHRRCRIASRQCSGKNARVVKPWSGVRAASVGLLLSQSAARRDSSQGLSGVVDTGIVCGTFALSGGVAPRGQTWRIGRHPEGDCSWRSERVRRRSKSERHMTHTTCVRQRGANEASAQTGTSRSLVARATSPKVAPKSNRHNQSVGSRPSTRSSRRATERLSRG